MHLLDTIVDIVIGPSIGLIDLRPQCLGVQVHIPLLRWQQVIELGVKHANDLTALVINDRVELLIPEYRHGEASFVIWIGVEIQRLGAVETLVQGVGCRELWPFNLFAFTREPPTVGQRHVVVH